MLAIPSPDNLRSMEKLHATEILAMKLVLASHEGYTSLIATERELRGSVENVLESMEGVLTRAGYRVFDISDVSEDSLLIEWNEI